MSNSPRKVSTAFPFMITRSPWTSHHRSPPRSETWRACSFVLPSIFGNAVARREVARNKIGVVPGSRDCDSRGMKFLEQSKIRTNAPDIFLPFINREVVIFDLHDRVRHFSQPVNQRRRRIRTTPGNQYRKIHCEYSSVAHNSQGPAETRFKVHRTAARLQNFHQDERRG
jgi:hypothetical protein